MAYTYEQFEGAATKAGMLDRFDDQDLIIARSNPEYGISMLQLMQKRDGARTAEQKVLADEAVRQLRQNYGGYVSGGQLPEYADEAIQQADNFYAEQNAYRRALAKAEGYGSTGVDPALKDLYSRRYSTEGARAATDALTKASVATGGRPSSYALALARQTKNDYDGQLQNALDGFRKDSYGQSMKPSASGNSQIKAQAQKVGAGLGNYLNKAAMKILPGPYALGVGLSGVIGKAADKTKELLSRPLPKETDRVKEITKDLDVFIPQWKGMGWTDEGVTNVILSHINARVDQQGGFTDEEMTALFEYLKKMGYYNG